MAVERSPQHRAFGQALREARVAAGFSQASLARAAELDSTYVSGIERGVRNPSLTNLFRLAETVGMPLSELVRLAEEKLPRQQDLFSGSA